MKNACVVLVKFLFIFVLFVQFSSCEQSTIDQTTVIKNGNVFDKANYAAYLDPGENNDIIKQKREYSFWEEKLKKTPGEFPYLQKIAGAATQLFGLTGDIKYLNIANDHLEEANQKMNRKSAAILRSAARSYITQHRFRTAHQALVEAEALGKDKEETYKMLFDVNMELGNYDVAKSYLNKVKKKSSFDHLIRMSKWEDHIGNLDRAIVYMESALDNATRQKNKSLMMWSHTNLADYYGHAGRIQDSYDSFIKALEINQNDTYAMKGIAWILYSNQKNTAAAKEILSSLMKRNSTPDYLLMMAEIAEYEGNEAEKNKWIDQYLDTISKPEYGVMYNKYKIELLAEDKQDFALAKKIAQDEIDMRPTPQSYGLLAWSEFLSGNKDKALKIVESKVDGKTYEPGVLYHAAEIYKANNRSAKVDQFKPDLIESIYELGPVVGKKIKSL